MGAPLLAEAYTVQERPAVEGGVLRVGTSERGPILPPWGSRERERELRRFYHHDYNTTFRGAIAGLIKRVQSTPWEVKAQETEASRYQRLLMQGDFGDWDRLLSKLIVDYSRHDQGGFLELIAPGDPRLPPVGPVVGISVLDSVRCYPTGNLTYPVIYYDIQNRMHLLHRSRVVQFVDTEDSDETLQGYGECALSRAIAPVYREILMARYVETFLDDKPPPGISVFQHITESMFQDAIARMERERQTDAGSKWGRNLRLYTLEMEKAPTVDHLPFTSVPEKYDFEKYTVIGVRQIALAIGLDIQDVWELTGGGLGTGTQSTILAQKSRGKAYGRILKALERIINRALPEDAEFAFQYKDPQEDLEDADKAQRWFSSVATTTDLSTEERRRLLANQVPAVRDVVTDEQGNIQRLPDDDPKPDESVRTDAQPVEEPEEEPVEEKQKAFTDTASSFGISFARFVRRSRNLGKGTLRVAMRHELNDTGRKAYNDGLRDGGVDPSEADAETLAERRRTVAEWVSTQSPYINSFVDDLVAEPMEEAEIRRRSDAWAMKSIRTIYYAGLAEASADKMVMWQYDPAKDHCDTCKTLHGQIHKLKDFIKAGYHPGASTLDCHGDQCGCKFVDVPPTTKVRGRMPRSRTGKPGFVDRLLGFIRRVVPRLGGK